MSGRWLTAAEAEARHPSLTPERLAALAALGALRQKMVLLAPLYDEDELEAWAAADAASLLTAASILAGSGDA